MIQVKQDKSIRINDKQIMNYCEENSPQAINETYKIWKKNVPFLYNLLQSYQLPSCSQSIDILPESYMQDSWRIHRMILGTNSTQKNYLMVTRVKVPTDDTIVDYTAYKEEFSNDPNIGTMGQQQLKILAQFPQNGEILRTRVQQAEGSELLAANVGGQSYEFFIYNLSIQQQLVEKNKVVLLGHDCEGFGLDWNPNHPDILATAAYDQKACVWELGKQGNPFLKPVVVKQNQSGVQDVQWSTKNSQILGCACQDKTVRIWDIREQSEKPSISKVAHNGEVYSVSFNPFSEYLFLSGGEDSDINLWDLRNMSKKLHCFIGHNESVSKVKWSGENPYTFTSSSFDRRLVVWDMQKLNNTQSNSEQILFIHGGHRTRITDFCWDASNKVCCSTEENNIVHVWQMNERILMD